MDTIANIIALSMLLSPLAVASMYITSKLTNPVD